MNNIVEVHVDPTNNIQKSGKKCKKNAKKVKVVLKPKKTPTKKVMTPKTRKTANKKEI